MLPGRILFCFRFSFELKSANFTINLNKQRPSVITYNTKQSSITMTCYNIFIIIGKHEYRLTMRLLSEFLICLLFNKFTLNLVEGYRYI